MGEAFTDIVTDATGIAVIAADGALQIDMNTGNSTAEALIDLVAGTYALEALFWERGGGRISRSGARVPWTRLETSCWSTVAPASSRYTDDKDGLELVGDEGSCSATRTWTGT